MQIKFGEIILLCLLMLRYTYFCTNHAGYFPTILSLVGLFPLAHLELVNWHAYRESDTMGPSNCISRNISLRAR